jgi:hypothetical protein
MAENLQKETADCPPPEEVEDYCEEQEDPAECLRRCG